MSGPDALSRLAATAAGSLLLGLVLPDGQRWGATAEPFQLEDAAAVLDPTGPRLHFASRPRGGRKSADAAALVLSLLLTEAPPGARAYGFAADQDQAALLVDSIRGYAEATPGLAGALDVRERKVVVLGTDASFEAIAADAPSAFGRRPWLTIVDEFATWPGTRGAGRLWEAAFSAVVKVDGARLLVITSAGDPNSLAAKVLGHARGSAAWRVSETPGPLRYIDPAALAEQRAVLLPSAYARLHLNRWTAAEDSLISRESLDALVTHDRPLDPVSGMRYVAGLDVGLVNDATVLVIAHLDPQDRATVVVDRVERLQGTKARPVQLAEVESLVGQAAKSYAPLEVRADPWQSVGLCQRLRTRGVAVIEWPFTSMSVGKLASTLYRVLQEGRIALPNDAQLLDELAAVRLRSNTLGTVRIDHEAGGHDDQVIALGLAVLALLERPVYRGGGRMRTPTDVRLTLPADDGSGAAEVARAARDSSPDPRSYGPRNLPPAELRFPELRGRIRW